jgi:phosphatidylglycerol:prolipoprotein diacylglycerol transferase
MIDPIIFSIDIGNFTLAFRWYGLLIGIAVMVGATILSREVQWRGGNPDTVWDGMLWVLPAGIVGARLWYVVNATLGGSRHYLDNPVNILRIPDGGLHIYGAFIFGLLAAYLYARKNKADLLLILDSIGPALLIGQALARPANFINQELYGPPTDLPWGISIRPENRLPPWNNLSQFPEETTRFHPTFAYEMIWNLLAAAFLLWISRRFKGKIKPGALFAGWLILAGLGRFIIEAFRPDQPRISGTDLSYSRLIAGLMALGGLFWLLVRYEVIRLPFLKPGPEEYQVKKIKGRPYKKKKQKA